MTERWRWLPLAPPTEQLVDLALAAGARQGLQVEFSTTITDEGVLVWCVQIVTQRGTLRRWPADLTQDAWPELLNEMGLLR
jgi:hypothetical protein